MKVTFMPTDLAYSADHMTMFLTSPGASEGQTFAEMNSAILDLYPQLDAEMLKKLPAEQVPPYLMDALREKYTEVKPEIEANAHVYQAAWDAKAEGIATGLSAIFAEDIAAGWNDVTGYINMNPICPRFLAEHSFGVTYLYSGKGAADVALHELVHFIWFSRWQSLYHDSPELYEQPCLPWVFSELAIDAILTDPRLNGFITHPAIAKEPAYPEFYEINTPDGSLIDVMRKLYASGGIEHFMRAGYQIVRKNAASFVPYFGSAE